MHPHLVPCLTCCAAKATRGEMTKAERPRILRALLRPVSFKSLPTRGGSSATSLGIGRSVVMATLTAYTDRCREESVSGVRNVADQIRYELVEYHAPMPVDDRSKRFPRTLRNKTIKVAFRELKNTEQSKQIKTGSERAS